MKTRLIPLALSLALGAATLALPAAAQSQQTPTGPGYGRMGYGMGPGMMGNMYGRGGADGCDGMMGGAGMMGGGFGMMGGYGMMRYPDGALAFLKTVLKITPAQTDAWNKVAQTMRTNMEAMQKLWMAQTPATQTLPAALDRREAMLDARVKAFRDMKVALVPLYDSFDAQQKQTADTLFLPCRGRGAFGRGRRGR